jgi:5-formyltetrahydrofolate cyclo-ligase
LQAREDPQPTAGAVPSAVNAVKSKAALRKEARIRRENLARSCPGFAQQVAGFVDDLPIAAGGMVAGYFSKGSEADVGVMMSALAARGQPLCMPAITAGGTLVFLAWRVGDLTSRNAYGIEEPLASSATVIPDAVLVPLLAFDSRGHRLGYGAGHFDRALKSLRASGRPLLAIGVAYAEQEINFIPDNAHDQPLDLLVSENGVRRFGSASWDRL